MRVTEVNVKPIDPANWRPHHKPLLAVCSVVFDHVFVIHEVKVIGDTEPLLVSMPSRKTVDTCTRCRHKVNCGDRYCGGCGIMVSPILPVDNNGDPMLYVNMAHPITRDFREHVCDEVRKRVAAVLSGHAPGKVPLSV